MDSNAYFSIIAFINHDSSTSEINSEITNYNE